MTETTTNITVRRLNDAGMDAFRALLTEMKIVEAPSDRIERARAIIADPAFTEAAPGAGEVTLGLEFPTAKDHTAHVYNAIKDCGPGVVSDRGVIGFLYLAHIEQLIGLEARTLSAYDLGMKSEGSVKISRNYRNHLWVRLTFHSLYGDDGFIMKALFGGKVHEHSDAADRMAQRPAAIGSKAYIMLNIAMFFERETGRLRKKPRTKGAKGKIKSAKEAMVEMSVVFGQYARNYAVSRMSALQLLDIIPDTVGLRPYKQFAKAELTEAAA
ncbi:hypothetical protein OIU34_17435 [Pararhizobium sp. BT-229]|uniref:hypothetical protein n=1 Tax=Pararhizobium sp. BT-229 TaxID=2986923 RepID=UPI0021F70A33|nr:hypothetical protein [Pararhizobium sp. BT-229]MCV9963686.1 hypothetical protein [Pararhizobium sp. BT-229]